MACGLSYDDVWVNLTPLQVKEYIELFYKNKNIDVQIQYNLTWLNAVYNHISTYNRKDFPKQPEKIIKEEETKKYQSDEEQNLIIDILLSQIQK